MRNPGSSPAASRIAASIAVVVVLPWVPATAMTCRSDSTCSDSHAGPEVYRSPSSRMRSTQGLPRVIALPITTTSGAGESWAGS